MSAPKKLTIRQIQIVLNAIALVEGWDADHPSVVSTRGGAWKYKDFMPFPSRKLITAIREAEEAER